MAKMTDAERDAFLLEPHLGNLAIGRVGKGPLLAPIWYRYTPGGSVAINMGATSAKAHRLRAEGRATMSVVASTGGVNRYVTIEGPVEVTPLGDETESSMLEMSSRYLGERGGIAYTTNFMAKMAADDLHDGHGTTEVQVTITPERWHTEVLG